MCMYDVMFVLYFKGMVIAKRKVIVRCYMGGMTVIAIWQVCSMNIEVKG